MENLNEQLNRIKSMMGLINEKTPNVGVITDYIENFKNITNEKDLITILTSRGFEKIEDLEIAKTYKLDLNKYKWVYYNPKRKSPHEKNFITGIPFTRPFICPKKRCLH
jgi:hypothetical protein